MEKLTPPNLEIARQRAEAYARFILDDEMPIELRIFAQSVYNAYLRIYNFSYAAAAELAMQMVRFYVCEPIERMEMVVRGEALQAAEMWREYERLRKLKKGI